MLVITGPVVLGPVVTWTMGWSVVGTGNLFPGRGSDAKACYRGEQLHRPEAFGARDGFIARHALQLGDLARERFARRLAR